MPDGTLVATLTGGGIAIASSFGLEFFKGRRESKALAMSFAGSISSVIDIIKRRSYLAGLETYIDEIATGNGPSVMKINASRHYAEIYSQNVGKIGTLRGKLPVLIPRFYILTASILEDVDSLHRGDWDAETKSFFDALYREMKTLLEEMIAVSEEITRETDREYAAIWGHWAASVYKPNKTGTN